MKKYLNKSLFYQGDAKIILPLSIAYIGVILFSKISLSNYFDWQIKQRLYGYYQDSFVLSFDSIVILLLYLIIVYIISVGIFKRKKWSTLLAGPFSRMDIRTREFIIVVMSAIFYLLCYLVIVGQETVQNIEIISYIGNFKEIVIIDVIRIISISTITIGGLALLDSIFSNMYYLFGSLIFIIIYMISLLINFEVSRYIYLYNGDRGLRYLYNGIMEYLGGYSIGNEISNLQIACISVFFIITGIVLIVIAKKLTNKMLVEYMNEGIIFEFPRRIAKFMLITFPGIILAPILSSLIDEFYFNYTLSDSYLIFIRLVIVIIITFFSNLALKKFQNLKKDKYYF
ncbi:MULTISPECIES: hypothetical protein [Clostridium]|jgi:hypothetical protein|uniref:hypothetical protein n=1 Tax=Clostridium TaxID=1485 RepID=UPI000288E402|nr:MULTISPECIES: hypothetical protein [Clostridium]EEH96875.2 hypothetical protein CSBG_00501 [Clostridium sp. 7_2_43FAA]MBU6134414.1 hypothetical protein [Clostridium tertium]MDB1948020.1 hypothetical protein [Clostridium tertium]MDU2158933.1 hypothetical protein [Clostridium sp.]MDU2681704.1 hypothetical protein [Clostridium sp.]